MPVTHNHQSSTPNNPAHEISSTRWNAAHTVSITNADVSASAAIAESKLALNFPTRAAVTPGGSNTNVQYNNTGTFAGSNNFTWDESSTALTLGGTSSGRIHGGLHSSGLALGLTLVGGDSGEVNGVGGALRAFAGTATGIGAGGNFEFNAGDGGDVSGAGGDVLLQAGDATSGFGGGVYLRPGSSDTLQHGTVNIEDPVTAILAIFDTSILSSNDRTYTFPDSDGTLAVLDGNGDLDFPVDTDGVILTDRTTGTRYRLYVDSGALLIEGV